MTMMTTMTTIMMMIMMMIMMIVVLMLPMVHSFSEECIKVDNIAVDAEHAVDPVYAARIGVVDRWLSA